MISGGATAHFWIYSEAGGLVLEVQRDQHAIDQLRS